ncbi:Maintenance of telomere capping protein 6 [Umbelopsis nana]
MPISNGHSNQWYHRFLPYLIALCSTSIAFAMVDENSPIHRENVSQSLIYEAATSYDDQVFTKQTLRSAWRSQRDLSMNISINRIQWPAINLASGFFGNNYTDVKVLNIASVLQAGYRRLVLDLYWQSDRGNWQLCPTNIPDAAFSQRLALTPELGKAISAQNRTVTHSSSLSTTPSSPPPTASPERKVKTLAPSKLLATKDEMFSNGVQLQADVTVSSYTCTPWITFRHFMQSIDVYLNSVDLLTNSEHTDLFFLILNLHSLNSTSTQTPPSVNTNSTWIGNMSNNQSLSLWETIDSTVGKSLLRTSKVYTPQNLTSDRANLTASFNTTGMPYYIAQTNANTHTLTTNTGWPPWLYLIQKQIQLLVGFGDNFLPSNTNYNVADDANFIFDQSALNGGSLMSTINVTSMASTGWTNCSVPGGNNFMVPSGNETTELVGGVVTGGNQVSWSWAYMTDQGSPFDYYSGNNAWTLTNAYYSYDRAEAACPSQYQFDAPRTAQQNRMLFLTIGKATRSTATSSKVQSIADQQVWIDLNNAGGQDCWVVGKNSTCWWANGYSQEFTGLIHTSVVGGVIILIFVSLFIWVKCSRMWRQRKAGIRKGIVRKLIQEREYVTVPA